MSKPKFRASCLARVLMPAIAAFSTVPATAAAPLLGAALDPLAIPGQYIVQLSKPGAGAAQSVARQSNDLLLGLGGGRVLNVYEHALRGFSVQITPEQATLLSLNPLVLSVEPDRQMRAIATQSGATWGLDRSDQRNRPMDGKYVYPDTAGQGVHVYVLDTGINANHSDFTGRVGLGRNFVSDKAATDPADCNGHGTHVASTAAGTVYGVAKKSTVHAVRVLGCTGSGATSGVIAGVDWVTANHVKPAVANMSLGGGASSALDTAVKNAIAAGVPFVAAAGNDNTNACNSSPARTPEAITVGATTNADAKASYSNFGTCLDLWAPGSSITAASHSSNTGTAVLSGTSMASPHVAGAVALILGRGGNPTAMQVRDTLVAESTSNVLTGSLGTGSPNRLLYVANATGGPAPVDNAPVADFTFSCSGLTCTFNGSRSTDDQGIAAYSWNFGDGSGGNGVSVTRSYAAGGTYSVTLTVTDTVNQVDTESQAVTVVAPTGANSPCADCISVGGTLAGGGTAYSPSSTGFASNGGTFKGYLRGPANADFDLYLERRSTGLLGSSWGIVARAETTSSNEDIVYSGTAGTYRWRIKSYSGSGSYTFYFRNP